MLSMLALLLQLSLIEPSYAQTATTIPVTQFNINLFTPIILGTVVALAISMLLLRLGLASGASVLKSKLTNRSSKKNHEHRSLTFKAKSLGNSIKSSAHIAGLGMTLMVGLSLFIGTYFATLTILPPTIGYLVTLAFFVWALYTIAASYVQGRVLSSTLSPAKNIAKSAFSTSLHTVQSVLGRSQSSQIKSLSHSIIKDIKKELKGEYEKSKLANQLDSLVKALENRDEDSRTLLTNLAEVINHTEIRLVPNEATHEEKVVVNTDLAGVRFSGPTTKKLSSIAKNVKEEINNSDGVSEKVLNAASAFNPLSEENTQKLIEKIKEVLRSTGNEDLDPRTLKEDFQQILQNPSEAKEILRSKVNQIHREDIIAAVTENTKLSREQIERNLEKIEDLFKMDQNTDMEKSEEDSYGMGTGSSHKMFSGLEGTNFDPSELEKDFEKISDNPKDLVNVLKSRMNQITREDVRILLREKTSLSEDHIENYLSKYDKYKSKAQQAKDKTIHTVQDAQSALGHLSKDLVSAGTATLWWRVAAPLAGAAGAIAGAYAAVV